MTTVSLLETFDAYNNAARQIQRAHASSGLNILVGMEIDWIRPSSEQSIKGLIDRYKPDMFVGSVHHVHTVPIDYDRPLYQKARSISGGTDEKLFEDYYDAQFDMLRALKPPVVGHFDLIRLKSNEPNTTSQQWPGVWSKILRNLDFIAEYGGLLEINSAALRKGMLEPYPNREICKVVTHPSLYSPFANYHLGLL